MEIDNEIRAHLEVLALLKNEYDSHIPIVVEALEDDINEYPLIRSAIAYLNEGGWGDVIREESGECIQEYSLNGDLFWRSYETVSFEPEVELGHSVSAMFSIIWPDKNELYIIFEMSLKATSDYDSKESFLFYRSWVDPSVPDKVLIGDRIDGVEQEFLEIDVIDVD